jgi:succinoglycan biosynthesis transport protein ExoP
MKKPRLSSARDYLALFVRRKWWIIVPCAALSAAIVLFAFLLPRIYLSETLILIRPRDVPEDFVKDLIAGSTEERLSAIEQTILSRTNLLQVLNQFESGLTEFRGLNDEEKVRKLRNQIQVSFQSEYRRGVPIPLTYFRISYQNQNPGLAQKINSRLASLFVEQDNRARETQVFGTTEFFSGEVQKVGEQLQQSEAKLRELKERYPDQLPNQLETNLRTLDRLGLQKRTNSEALDRYVGLRLNLERQISQTPPVLPRDTLETSGSSVRREQNPLVEDYRKKLRAYHELVAQYTVEHPDVQRTKAELDRLGKGLSPQELAQVEQPFGAEASSVTFPNPVYESLATQLREMKTEIEIREKERQWIESEMARYMQRVQGAPRREQELAAVLRNHTELTKQFEDLKGKLDQAKLSESLESRQKGSQFEIVDPANYPLVPAKPNRIAIIWLGLMFGLGLGIAIGFTVDSLNHKVWTQSEIENALGALVLVEIPRIITEADLSLARKRKMAHALLFVVSAALYIGGLYFLYMKQSSVLRHLDPIIGWL